MKELYDKSNAMFLGTTPPTCLSPATLKGRTFSELALSEFHCRSPMFRHLDVFMTSDGRPGRLRCVASGEPAPILYWIEPSGKTTKFKPPGSGTGVDSTEASLSLFDYRKEKDENGIGIGDVKSSRPSEMYICVANNQAGNIKMTMNVPLILDTLPTYQLASDWNLRNDTRADHDVTFGNEKPAGLLHTFRLNKSHSFTVTSSTDKLGNTLAHPITNSLRQSSALAGQPGLVQDSSSVSYTCNSTLSKLGETSGYRSFNVHELVAAVLLTHLITIVSCFIILEVFWCRDSRSNRWCRELSTVDEEVTDVSSS